MKPEETIDHPIRWAWHRIARRYNAEAAQYGGSMSIGYALLNIDPEGTPSTKLGPKMGMEPRSLTRTLRNMEEKGLIQRRPDGKDGRMMRIFLTPEGKRMRDISKAAVLHFNELVQANIPARELVAFHAVMHKINALLDRDDLFK
ncbi:MAG: MarR family transcriptional regulator [Bacteroidetes bacterium]|nr:MarR family transcriptional regulator [Bacteroidota bacterium]